MGKRTRDDTVGQAVAKHTGEIVSATIDEQIGLCEALGVPSDEALAGVESALVVTLARFLAETFPMATLDEMITVTCLKLREATLQLAKANAAEDREDLEDLNAEPPERTH